MGKLSSVDTSATYPYGAMNFISRLGIRFRIANSHAYEMVL